ncbi:hypothetical protein K2Z83_24560 [Oscillochloris sp. ZM17-4]|uniref:Eco57I restriction-modification methylase domain-containing protein n=1 Tax=Oscillochloris sp. ZM17-4 TaxID=2866714 RepID=UPI001C734203|nr:type IIL restriction-modification enzyme MmeI [Oscillochloris sp. ZM17-4]MBX0330835.1 hypothetical protein [Oscillochloris sp. ZM17-4]
MAVAIPEHGETLTPDIVIAEPAPTLDSRLLTPRILVQIVPPGQDLEKAPARAVWQASPATRMMTLLRGAGVRLGLLTNGEQWMLVDRPADENLTTGFASWYARLWLDEPLTLRAFRSLLGAHRIFGMPDDSTLEALLAASADDRQEVTDQLGYQVRRAVELLVQAIDLADQNAGRAVLTEVREERLYEAALAVMMRLVFLLFAEEQGLLLLGDDLYDRNYAVSTLLESLRLDADRSGEEVLERRHDAWGRLLAIFRAVSYGFDHDKLDMPAYGGSLFDPDRYPFLEGRVEAAGDKRQTAGAEPRPLLISNRVVLHLLEALQVLRVKLRDGSPAEARRISFRALDIEQIGHVYEGLLDHTALRASEPVLGIAGTRDQEPEIALADLERESQRGEASFLAYLKEQTGRSESALRKAWKAQPDAFRATLLRGACGNDAALYDRVLPFAGLVRDDDYARPVVIPAGSVYVTTGTERRATGTHYTPRSLTEPIVQHTLEPLVYVGPAEGLPKAQWRLRPAAELLQLTVCDMAMGSGAFLVQACRYLSERLLEAFDAEESEPDSARKAAKPQSENGIDNVAAKEAPSGLPGLSGFAALREPARLPDLGVLAPLREITDPTERLIYARRLVADRCLYGVDKNPLAVEMAKLSLWLITLAKGRPFSFLDHALRAGDSLLGIGDVEQLSFWALSEKERDHRLDWVNGPVEKALRRAFALRREIQAMPVREARDAAIKQDKLAQAEAVMADVRLGADLLVAAALAADPKARAERRGRFLTRYAMLVRADDEGRDVAELRAELRGRADKLLQGRRPFHWPLEFPEVFVPSLGERPVAQMLADAEVGVLSAEGASPGFAAVVGNPPFVGGRRIRETLGNNYRDALYEVYPGSSGNADLSAFFFLRSFSMLHRGGTVGLIATNTIAQGDTRLTGLDAIVGLGGVIYHADNNKPWPGQAAVVVSVVHIVSGEDNILKFLDGHPVDYISSLLDNRESVGAPKILIANQGKSFQGSVVVGMGFVLEPGEAQAMIERNPRNREVLFPYLNGEDLNGRPDQSPSRWVINFFDWPLEKAEKYPEPMAIVREKVYPVRANVNREAHRKYWWHYGDKRPALYATIAGMERVLVLAQVSRTLAFTFVPNGTVYSHKIVVFDFSEATAFAALQSNFHAEWAWKYSSTMKSDLSYSPSDVLITFPFPACLQEDSRKAAKPQSASDPSGFAALREPSGSEIRELLESIGEQYHAHRQQIMRERNEGLTKTYNRFHAPGETSADIAELRRLHVEMDEAVAAAYGWHDLDLGHGFHETKQGLRYTISEAARRAVLDRLLALNHQRYAEEVAAGLHEKKGAGKGKGKGGRKGKAAAEPKTPSPEPSVEQGELF